MSRTRLLAILARSAISIAVVPTGLALPLTAPASAAPGFGDRARDRASILAMAGTFKVTFDMRETLALVPGYALLKPKLSGGHEVVRVISDAPELISLQHMLVVEVSGERPMVVKHWRQDWAWQPRSVLTYAGPGRWSLEPVPAAEARSAWSQTVYQTDDSPRYGGIGRWRYDDGVARWTSTETSRPLARRDATRNPPYDHYVGINRHVLTPAGWAHEQDNAKIGAQGGRSVTFAHEVLLNTYVRSDGFPVDVADDYWSKSRAYWAFVRSAWERRIAIRRGIRLEEEPENGSVTGHELMSLADDVVSSAVTLQEAEKRASALIERESH